MTCPHLLPHVEVDTFHDRFLYITLQLKLLMLFIPDLFVINSLGVKYPKALCGRASL